jgi:hypothetical protein
MAARCRLVQVLATPPFWPETVMNTAASRWNRCITVATSARADHNQPPSCEQTNIARAMGLTVIEAERLFGLISIAAAGNRSQSEASARSTAVNQHPEAHPQAGPFSSYDDFKSQYLSLAPEVADSPALLASLIRHQAFDWLNQLVEESLGEEPLDSGLHGATDHRHSSAPEVEAA